MPSKIEFPNEILAQIGDRADWRNEFERRHTLHNLILASHRFHKVFTTILYREFEHTEEDWRSEQHLRALLKTLGKRPDFAGFIHRLTVVKWSPEAFFDARLALVMQGNTYDLVNQLISLAGNVRELKIRLPNLPLLDHKPFLELRKLHLLDFVPFVRALNGDLTRRREVYVPTINRDDRALNLRALSAVCYLPRLSQLNIEAFDCLGESSVHYDRSMTSRIDSFQIHAGSLDAGMVRLALKLMRSLKVFRYSMLKSLSSRQTRPIDWTNPNETPSTSTMIEALESHKTTLTTLEITKNVGLSSRGGEIVESLSTFEHLRSLCIDAAMLLGRWQCKHQAGKIDENPATVLTWADIDKSSRRRPSELADCLPSGMEELIVGINDDMSDTFILDIVSGLVRQRSRLSALRKIAFYRNRSSYCPECLKWHGKFSAIVPVTDDAGGFFTPIKLEGREQVMLAKLVQQLTGTAFKVFPAFKYVEWPTRSDLWDMAGPHLTGESDTSDIRTVQFRLNHPVLYT